MNIYKKEIPAPFSFGFEKSEKDCKNIFLASKKEGNHREKNNSASLRPFLLYLLLSENT